MHDAERYDKGERGYVAEVVRMAAERRRAGQISEFDSISAQLSDFQQVAGADDTATNHDPAAGGTNG